MEFRTGCCGLAGLSLRKYSALFEVMEVQSTFYRLPGLDTAAEWRKLTPSNFEFTMKVFQGVTHPITSPTWRRAGSQRPKQRGENYGHLKPTQEALTSWARSLEVASVLNAKVSVVQLPPSFTCTGENVRQAIFFFKQVSRPPITVVEVRHPSWYQRPELLGQMLDEINGVHVVDPLVNLPVRVESVAYFRLHGLGEERYRYRYSNDDLRQIRNRAKEFGADVVYVMFNNLAMREDATRFQEVTRREAEKE